MWLVACISIILYLAVYDLISDLRIHTVVFLFLDFWHFCCFTVALASLTLDAASRLVGGPGLVTLGLVIPDYRRLHILLDHARRRPSEVHDDGHAALVAYTAT